MNAFWKEKQQQQQKHVFQQDIKENFSEIMNARQFTGGSNPSDLQIGFNPVSLKKPVSSLLVRTCKAREQHRINFTNAFGQTTG